MQCQANLFNNLFGNNNNKDSSSTTAPLPSAPPPPSRANAEVFMMAGTNEAPLFPPYSVIKRSDAYDLR